MRAVLALILAAVLMACGGPVKGTVVGKTHEDAHTYIHLQPIPHTHCTGGKYPSCFTTFTYIPMPMTDDEDWYLVVRDAEGKDHSVSVTHETHDGYDIGDYVSFE
jgi:hypothetical protein